MSILKLDTGKSDNTSGFFYLESANHNSSLLNKISSEISPETLYNLFISIQEQENKNRKNEIKVYSNMVYNGLFESSIYKKGFDLEELAKENTRLNYRSSAAYMYYILRLRNQDFVKNRVLEEGWDDVNEALSMGKGAVLSFYHWSIFQAYIHTIITKFKKKVALFAAREIVDYTQRLVDNFAPESKDLYISLPANMVSFKRAIDLLKNNVIICILPEVTSFANIKKEPNYTNFLGMKINMPIGPATMAAYGGAPLFSSYLEEIENEDTLKIKFNKINEVATNNRRIIIENSKLIWKDLEKRCLIKPEQWFGWELMDRIMAK